MESTVYKELETGLLTVTNGRSFMSVQELGDYLGLAGRVVRVYIRNGRLPGKVMPGRRGTFIIPVASVIQFLIRAGEVKVS